MSGGLREFLAQMNIRHPKKLLFIVVNAAARRGTDLPKQYRTPGSFKTIELIGDNRAGRANALTLEYARMIIDDWHAKELAAAGREQAGASDARMTHARRHPIPELYLAMVDFERIADPCERNFFQNLPTSFHLPGKTIDRLTEAGGRLLRTSPDFQGLLRTLNEEPEKVEMASLDAK